MQQHKNSNGVVDYLKTDLKKYPYVMEDRETKSLHFDDLCVQSSMRLDDPFSLVLGYTRAMMGFLLLSPSPRDVLIVGLGGGSLSKYCCQKLSDSVITTIEISTAVIALRDNFSIPPDSERFKIIQANAADYLSNQSGITDVLLLDGYDPDGIPADLSSQKFYDECFQALRPGGVLVSNVWGSDRVKKIYFNRIAKSFSRHVLITNCDSSNNYIVFALKQVDIPPWMELQSRACEWESDTGLNFNILLDKWCMSAESTHGTNWLER